MGIIGNKSILYKSPATFIGGGAAGLGNDAATYSPSRNRSRYMGDDYPDLAATPFGAVPDTAWVMPIKGGAISSINDAVLAISTSASGVSGFPIVGSTTYSITFADAIGELIVSGDGSTAFSITTNNPLLTASLQAIGATEITITTNTPILGAEASLTATSTYSFTGTADILPLDDTPPVRTATTSYTITGTLTPYALGNMIGSALPYTELSPQSLANAVWDSLIADHQQPGSTGEALFGAGGGTTPTSIWQYAIEGGYTAEEVIRLISAALAGKVSGADTSTITFRDLTDTKDRIVANLDGLGNRTALTINAV